MDDLDHRAIGQRHDLFHLQDDAPGMVFWHPRGYAIYRALEDFVRGRMRRLGFREVRTPQIVSTSLWERSGHMEKFGNSMFRVEDGDRTMAVKPMSCPCHIQIFNRRIVSWRDLPVRYSEFGACHRNEPSGALHGLMRTRSFVQDDAHILCLESHVRNEVARFVAMVRGMYLELGFPSFEVGLSTRPTVRASDDVLWDRAEAMLAEAASDCGLSYVVQPGEGAFYGPKLEFALSDRIGRRWQCGTVQLDFVLPGRLGASYVAADGSPRVPVMIHHAVLGSMERFIGILLEHHEGCLPIALAPDQVVVLPVSEHQAEYAEQVHNVLCGSGLRSVLDDRGWTLPRRIVDARKRGIPVLAVVGRREVGERAVALRTGSVDLGMIPLDQASAAILDSYA